MTHSIQNFSFHAQGDLHLNVPNQKRDENPLWPLTILASTAKATWNLPMATVNKIKHCLVRKEGLEGEIDYWIEQLNPKSKGKELKDPSRSERLTVNPTDALVQVFVSPDYASFDRGKIQRLINLCDAAEIKNVIEKVIETGVTESEECTLNIRSFDVCDFDKVISILSEISEGTVTKTAIKGEIVELITAKKWSAFIDDSVRVVPMLYSTMRSSGRYLIKLMELIVMASSKLGLVIFGNAVKIKGKELASMATPIQLFLVYLATNYLIYNTTIGAELVAQYTLLAAGVTSLGYLILAVAVVYPVFHYMTNYFQPCPIQYKSAENVTELARTGRLTHVFRRGGRLKDFITCLERNGRVCLHGEKGSGKKTMKESLAKRIAMGELCKDSPLANRQLFSFDMKNPNALEELKSFIQDNARYKDEIVVFVENGFKLHDHGEFESQLRILFNTFDYVVLSVNDNNWVEGKFPGVTDHPLHEERDGRIIKEMMQKYVDAKAPHLYISNAVIGEIYKKSTHEAIGPQMKQPGKAMTMLSIVIDRDRPIGQQQWLDREGELEDKIVSSDSETVVLLSGAPVGESTINDVRYNRKELPNMLEEAQEKLKRQSMTVKRLWETEWLKWSLDQAQLRYAWKILRLCGKDFDVDDPKIQRYMKKWVIIKRIIIPCLDRLIESLKTSVYEEKFVDFGDGDYVGKLSESKEKFDPFVRVIDKKYVDKIFPDATGHSVDDIVIAIDESASS